ncbi:3-phosphoshikimate 1-carboxyvinyltransferase [Arboricoccus pini]|uniref:3-phosphoshikimate 1-carboxyvinyltransferase n=1 Tax=Arboricoccus pini TaxID=1963835 RepID=A0A212R794_9PROT|nr:hypothetical protein [Arboricoccus pini]SNB67893.1 3-phosphoshikimate 1-carboxyvinyltransferase [Arboricoccus pini]
MPLRLPVSSQQSTTLKVPPDPRSSIDALMMAALAVGKSRVDRLASHPHIDAFMLALQELGVLITLDTNDGVLLHGVGVGGFLSPASTLPVSAMTFPLLLGALVGHAFDSIMTCEGSGSVETMLTSLLPPLAAMGVIAKNRPEPRFPLLLEGRSDLMPVEWDADDATDGTLLRTLLLAGLHAPGTTSLCIPRPSTDPILTALQSIGAKIEEAGQNEGRLHIAISGQPELKPADWAVAGDDLIAACLIVTAACSPGASVILEAVPNSPAILWLTRSLKQAGATIKTLNTHACYGGFMIDLAIDGTSLSAIDVELENPLPSREFSLLLASGLARGSDRSVLRGLGPNASMRSRVARLAACGVAIDVVGDNLVAGGTAASATADLSGFDDDQLTAAFLTAAGPTRAALIGSSAFGDLALSCLRQLVPNARDERHS